MEYQICKRCIMDTSDPLIVFNQDGICNHCLDYDKIKEKQSQLTDKERQACLDNLITQIKEVGKKKPYDCVVGVSGGVDSTYVAYLAKKKFGLRPLAVHFDCGWNSELATNNIENIVKKLDIDLYTQVVDWREMQDLQLAFFKASVANCDIPTDHALVAVLFSVAAKHGIKYIITGSNNATESILPIAWGHPARDLLHLKAISRLFGKVKLKHYPMLGVIKECYYRIVRRIKLVNILNHVHFVKADVKKLIMQELDWRDYGGKHYESVFTRFFQAYYLPHKFGYDKRRAHLSSLIVSGQLSRDEALEEMKKPTYPEDKLQEEKVFVAKKLGVSPEELDKIIAKENKSHRDYPTSSWFFDRYHHFARWFSWLVGRRL